MKYLTILLLIPALLIGQNLDRPFAEINDVHQKTDTQEVGATADQTGVEIEALLDGVLGTDWKTPTTLLGENYLTLSGQEFTAALINLATHVTGVLPDANVANDITLNNITQVTARSHTDLQDIGTNTHAQLDTHVANNSGVNTGDVTIAAGLGYVTIAGQELTLGPVSLATDVSGSHLDLAAIGGNSHGLIDVHIDSTSNNPHQVNQILVGLPLVDNTSDLQKPVSTATQNALDLKAESMGDLSDVDLTGAASTQILELNAGVFTLIPTPSGGGGPVEGTAILSTAETIGLALITDGAGGADWLPLGGGGDALTANPLNQFAATTSQQLADTITDETGSGLLVYNNAPVLIAPDITNPTGIFADDITVTNGMVVVNPGDLQTVIEEIDEALANARSTGVRSGGEITINANPLLANIAQTDGQILDNSDPQNPVYYDISFPGANGVTVTNTGAALTYWYLDNTGTLLQTISALTPQQIRLNLFLGVTAWQGGQIVATGSRITPVQQQGNQFRDLSDFLGKLKHDGEYAITAAAADLSVAIGAGTMWVYGSNIHVDPLQPHTASHTATNPTTFNMVTETGPIPADVTQLDVANMDVGGVVTPVGGAPTRATNFTVYKFPSTGNVDMQYDNQFYASLELAVDGLKQGNHSVTSPPGYDEAITIGWISVQIGETNLSTDAVFTPSNIFGGVGGSSPSQSGTFLQVTGNLLDVDDPVASLANIGGLPIDGGTASNFTVKSRVNMIDTTDEEHGAYGVLDAGDVFFVETFSGDFDLTNAGVHLRGGTTSFSGTQVQIDAGIGGGTKQLFMNNDGIVYGVDPVPSGVVGPPDSDATNYDLGSGNGIGTSVELTNLTVVSANNITTGTVINVFAELYVDTKAVIGSGNIEIAFTVNGAVPTIGQWVPTFVSNNFAGVVPFSVQWDDVALIPTDVISIWARISNGSNAQFGIDLTGSVIPHMMTASYVPGGGDVTGPASAVNQNIAIFDGTTGKLIADAGIPITDVVTSTSATPTSTWIPSWTGGANVLSNGFPITSFFGYTHRQFSGTSATLDSIDVAADTRDSTRYMDSALANEMVIPTNITLPSPNGVIVRIIQFGTGTTSIRAVAGVTVNGVDGGTVVGGGQYSLMTLVQAQADEWVVAISPATVGAGAPTIFSDDFNAGAMIPTPTNPATVVPAEGTTTFEVTADYYRFDDIVQQSVGMWRTVPKGYVGSTVTATYHSKADGGTGTAVYEISARAFAHGDALDQALGTIVNTTATITGTGLENISPESASITPAGTVAEGNAVYFEVSVNSSGTLASPIDLKSIDLLWE